MSIQDQLHPPDSVDEYVQRIWYGCEYLFQLPNGERLPLFHHYENGVVYFLRDDEERDDRRVAVYLWEE